MGKDKRLYPRCLCHATRIYGARMMRQDALLESRRIGNRSNKTIDGSRVECIMNQDVGTARELNEVLRWRCVAGNDDRPIRNIEPISKRRRDGWMVHKCRCHPHVIVLEDQPTVR